MLEDMDDYKPRPPCRVMRIHSTLEPADQERLLKFLGDDETWTNYMLTKALNEKGIQVSETSIRRHRQSFCPCKPSNA